MKRLEGKVAIVTGGGGGLGRAISLRLAEDGAAIAVADVSMSAAQETVQVLEEKGQTAFAVECDVTSAESVQAMVATVKDHYKKIDILVNNAGRCIEARTSLRLCDMSEEIWDTTVSLNLKSAWLCCKYVLPEMYNNGIEGRVCNVASVGAYFPSWSGAYAACKAGIMQITKAIAMQYADDKIRCNCVCPGAMRTPGGINANKVGNLYATADQPRVRMIDRLAEPSEVANAVCFLVSDEASYITGTEIKVDGGSMAVTTKIPPRVK